MSRMMSEITIRPPGLRMRAISLNTTALSGTRLITQLLVMASTVPSSTGSFSSRPSRNSTFVTPAFAALRRARASISGVISTPMTLPVGPTVSEARKTSIPAPEPRSTTVSPG